MKTAMSHPNWHPEPWSVPQELAGHAEVRPDTAVVAGSWQTFEVVYTVGKFGIDDSGSIKVCFRFATDQTRLQLSDPAAPGYVTVAASNGATLDARFDYKQNVRPYDRTLHIKVVRGFMKEGDTITVRIGDRVAGSPGVRVQTFSEPRFTFRVLADPIACYQFVPVAEQPTIAIEAGPRALWTAVVPTVVAVDETFTLRIRSEDAWGNPSGVGAKTLQLRANQAVSGLPRTIELDEGTVTVSLDGLSVAEFGVLRLELIDQAGAALCEANPLVVAADLGAERVYWADFHAQSAETIGTNSAEEYFAFARDVAFLDIVGHQGNDFQITQAFWRDLNRLYDETNEDGRFITIPGYEWSGNTPLGGDRNVFFAATGRPIRRSSHALVPDRSDAEMDCHTASDLFTALRRDREDAVTFAHVGGRYADIAVAHDPVIETAVEVHSTWGTFEWIVNDAFDLGYRVGIVANSDGHKGRPGAEAPGASMFGAYGGLTALKLTELSRPGVFGALRARRHYATTGSRMMLNVKVTFNEDAIAFDKDPALGATSYRVTREAGIGEIVHSAHSTPVTVHVSAAAPAPIERIEFRRGRELVHVHRPYGPDELGKRIRVIWSGAEYRGRFRMTAWDGRATVSDNEFTMAAAINFLNRDRTLEHPTPGELTWKSITTGNFSGFDAMLAYGLAGTLRIETPLGTMECPVASIGMDPIIHEFGGLDRRLTVQRLPDLNKHHTVEASCVVECEADKDNPIYVSVITEDGHQGWSSPVYVVPRPGWL